LPLEFVYICFQTCRTTTKFDCYSNDYGSDGSAGGGYGYEEKGPIL
jgi:hypothetical protein